MGRLSAARAATFAGADAADHALAPAALAILACGAAANLLVHGLAFPGANNLFHVAIVLDYAGSVEGPHDAFHQTLGNFVSLMWPLLSLLATEANVGTVFLALYAANRAALLLLIYLCAWEIAPRRDSTGLALAASAVLLAVCAAWRLSPLGYSDVFVIYLSHTQVGLTLLVASLWLALRGQWLAAAALIGVNFNVNAFIAVWSAAMLTAAHVWTGRGLREFARGAAAAALLALPTAIWIYRTVAEAAAPPDFDYRRYLLEFFPLHNLVHLNWRGLVIAACLAAVVLVYIRNARLFRSAGQRQTMLALFTALIGVLALGCAMPYVANSRLLYNLYPLRMDSVLIPLFIVLAAAALVRTRTADDRGFWLHLLVVLSLANGNMPLALFAAALAAGMRRVQGVLVAGCAAFVALTGEGVVYFQPPAIVSAAIAAAQCGAAALALRREALRSGTLLLTVALALPALLPHPLAEPSRYGLGIVYLAAATWLQLPAGTPLERAWLDAPVRWVRAWSLTAIVGVALIAGIANLARTGTINQLPAKERAFAEAQLWLRTHSRPDELVLPLTGESKGFSTLSRRPVWVDPRMGAAVMWSPDYYPEWRARMTEVKALPSADEILAYARRNGIAYVVVPAERSLAPADTVYRNGHFHIARVAPQ